MQNGTPETEIEAFLASVSRRTAALADAGDARPFDPQTIANAFISRIQGHTNIGQIIHTYAEAMLSIDPGATAAWRKLNEVVDAVSWPYKLHHVQKMAAEINRKNGNMPSPTGASQ